MIINQPHIQEGVKFSLSLCFLKYVLSSAYEHQKTPHLRSSKDLQPEIVWRKNFRYKRTSHNFEVTTENSRSFCPNCLHHQLYYNHSMKEKRLITVETTLTDGGDPLDSSNATPKMDIRAPNQIREGTFAPNMPSSKGTTTT